MTSAGRRHRGPRVENGRDADRASTRGRSTSRWPWVVVVMAAIAALAVTFAPPAPTSATWVDPTSFAMAVSAGTWTVDPPEPPRPTISDGGISAGNDATSVADIAWSGVTPDSFCATVNVTGTSASPQPWALTIDRTRVPFRGLGQWDITTPDGGDGAPGPNNTYVITGKAGGWVGFDPTNNNTPITNAQTATVRICVNYSQTTSQGDPSWYTVAAAPSTDPAEWTNTRACIITTVTTTQTSLTENPFFYGWTTTLDLSPAIARIVDAGGRADQVQWTPYPDNSGLTSNPGPGTMSPTYQLTSGGTTAIRAIGSGRESATVKACVVHYT